MFILNCLCVGLCMSAIPVEARRGHLISLVECQVVVPGTEFGSSARVVLDLNQSSRPSLSLRMLVSTECR